MRLSPDIEPSSVLFFMLFVLVMGCYFYYLVKRDKVRHSSENWYCNTLKDLGINENDIILNNSLNNLTAENVLVYTQNDFVYVINKIYNKVSKVYKKDILKVDMKIYSVEKNVKKLVALTSTFDKRVNVTGLELTIVTTKDTYNILLMADGKDVNKVPVFNKRQMIDEVDRCKLMLERDIENLKGTNN